MRSIYPSWAMPSIYPSWAIPSVYPSWAMPSMYPSWAILYHQGIQADQYCTIKVYKLSNTVPSRYTSWAMLYYQGIQAEQYCTIKVYKLSNTVPSRYCIHYTSWAMPVTLIGTASILTVKLDAVWTFLSTKNLILKNCKKYLKSS